MIKKFFNALLDTIYPPRCIICDEVVSSDKYFCEYCDGLLTASIDKRCLGCGMYYDNCRCNNYIYHFDGVISPYYNEGAAKKCVYNFKFKRNRRASEILCKDMADIVNKFYDDKYLDVITSVCASNKNTEYDQCKILATKLSEYLNIKYIPTLERTDKKREVQHGLVLDKRFENVHNAYKATVSLKGKNVLLVDDIKTSGATIDECARQLKFAGADSVYCITALVGKKQKQD